MEAKDYIYAGGILVTFILGVWNFIQGYRLTRKTSFIKTVTSQRVKWIEQIRQDVSAFSGLTHSWCRQTVRSPDHEQEMLQEIDRLRHVIRLRLNPEGIHDQKIEQLIKRIPELTDISKHNELYAALDELTIETQEMLKEEWEKVKAEAKDGDLKEK